MIVSQKSNDTLAMCHILDRSVVCHLCSSVQTPSRPRLLNLTHSISLPEREDLPKEVLDWCNLTQNDKSSLAGKTDEKRTRKSRGYKSSPTLCVLSENTSWLKKEPLTHRGTSRRHNLFIPETELNEDEEDEDSDGDNLHKYHEGSSLQLQGNVTRCGSEEKKDREYEGHSDRKGTPVLMDCDEQEWGEGENFGNHTPEETENCWAPTEDYITDSSCTSSDGIIVNFSAIYDKSNNAVPASPINLDSPVHRVSHHWSSHSIDPNCNVYQSNGGFSTVEISDLSMHQLSLTRFANSTKNYYKLVTCDVSQCSPSPPWSSLTSFSETQSPGSSSPSEYFLFGDAKGEQREKIKCDQQVNAEVKNDCRISKEQCKGTNERTADRKSATPRKDGASVKNKASIPNLTALQQSCSSHLDTNLSSSSSGHHATTFAEIVQTKRGTGDCSFKKSTDALSSLYFTRANPNTDNSIPIIPEDTSSPEVLRYTKAQRPNFLPIQPFVLQSRSGQQPNKALGSLLDQYINNEHTNPGPHKATCKTKGLSENIPLETTTSLDTCSTCTSSPIQMLLSPKRPGSGMNAPECMPLVQAILEPRKRSKDSLYASIHLHTNSSSATTSVTSLVSNSISSLEAASLDSTQASHTSKPSLLKAVSLAVDLVLAHFNLRSNPDEKISLGNSLQCSTINNLVLKELYPTVLNILQHGLKAYKLDLIIGQRRNTLWNVIEATAQQGSSNHLPDVLVSLIKRCSKLSSSIRLRVFFIELLNLRALEFWMHHLHTCTDLVMDRYHQWGFLIKAKDPSNGQLFQKLQFLLQPLSLLPFNLHFPSYLSLQSVESDFQRPPLLHHRPDQSSHASSIEKSSKSPAASSHATTTLPDKFWINQSLFTVCNKDVAATEMVNAEIHHMDDKGSSTLQWARLFGSGAGTKIALQKTKNNISRPPKSRRPSEWLKLGASKVDLLTQSMWTSGQRN